MRLKGTIKSWNDERGFGFIEPLRGGQDIFVHISAFPRDASRPQINQRVYFEVELGPEGKKRARNVELFGHPQTGANAPRGTGTLVMIPAFVIMYVIFGLLWGTPFWVALIYLAASVITFSVYANDKSNAQRGQWRTSESALHLLSLAGGWPGALLAQQLLRHKSAKTAFRMVFWGTVVLNVAVFILLCTPLVRSLLSQGSR
jgi:uncharacterized membrane protein YsdA (DUF1294 family)/cold shock CspA family protein